MTADLRPRQLLESIDVDHFAKEIPKSYAVELVRQGFGYRLCVCDELTAEKKARLQKSLNEAAQAIHPGAPVCHVLTASDLAECANRFPSLVATMFERPSTIPPHEARIRVIAIDNTGEPPPHGAPGIWIEKIALQTAEQILQPNFPMIPAERRRAYADLSGGYIRLAADLCRHDIRR